MIHLLLVYLLSNQARKGDDGPNTRPSQPLVDELLAIFPGVDHVGPDWRWRWYNHRDWGHLALLIVMCGGNGCRRG